MECIPHKNQGEIKSSFLEINGASLSLRRCDSGKYKTENSPGNFKSDSSCCSVGRLSNNEVALSNVPVNSGRRKKNSKV